jgi:uncharacterized repeat protein (TIGR01451 family)/MYXO-CTERM domain-containing protein
MTMKHRRVLGALAGAVVLGLMGGEAAAAPSLRKQVIQHGDFALIGNTLGQDCRALSAAEVQVGTVGTCPAGTTGTSFNGPDVFWESDFPAVGQATASTAITLANARSTSVLKLPAGATVTQAYLYWSGRPGIVGTTPNPPDTAVVLDRPGGGGFTANVTAGQTWSVAATGTSFPAPYGMSYPGYQGFADVTAIVQQNGAGAYRVGNVDSLDVTTLAQSNTAVGWWMVVIYQDPAPAVPQRTIALFDGFDFVGSGAPLVVNLSGFAIPAAGYTAHLGVVAMDGDSSTTGDTMQFNGNVVTDALNPANNFFNGTRSYLGLEVSNAAQPALIRNTGDLPQLSGKQGSMSEMDMDVVDVTAFVMPGQTTATITADNTGDVAFLSTYITSVTTLAPDFITSTKTVTDLTSGTTSAHPGDILQYTITATNVGTDAAVNTVLNDPLPANVTYVPGSLQVLTGANAGAKTDAAGDDQADYDGVNHVVHARLGTGANGAVGGSLTIGQVTTFTFKVQINAGATGTVSNQGVITAGGSLGTPNVDYPTDGNGPLAGAPPTVIIIANCPIASCACLIDSDCGGPTSATVCDNGAGGTFTCIPGCRGQGGNGCMPGSVCTSTTPAIGNCVQCDVDTDCSGGNWCNEAAHTCTPRLPNGTPVAMDPPHTNPTLNGTCSVTAGALVCVSGVCDVGDNKCGYANGSGPCNLMTGPTVCRSGICDSAAGICIPPGGCAIDSDCAADQWCDTPTFTCTPKVPNGQPVPTSPGHNPTLQGVCTGPAAVATCVSGVCDVSDNLCGFTNGTGPCTTITGPVVCRSGMCGSNGVCVGVGGCNVDTDCTGGNWCNETAHTCTPKLPNGSATPVDPPHTIPTLNGMCDPAVGALVCQSGVCDAGDDKCGYPNGSGPCDDTTGATVCRSGICAVTGPSANLCVECLQDAQCPTSAPTCDPATNACVTEGCTQDADCGGPMSGQVCNLANGTCGPGCRGEGGNGCPTGQVCTSMDATIGQCVQCNQDADCGGPTSGTVCDATHQCGPGCRGMGGNGCATDKVCTSQDTTIGQCVECTKDAECGGPMSGTVCDVTTNKCGPGCRGQGGNGCKAGDVCTSLTTVIGTCGPAGAGGAGGGTGGSGTGANNDGYVASGNGLICSAQPGRDDEGSPWLLGGLAGLLLALRRRRR